MKSKVFLINSNDGSIACKDGKFRTSVNFGTPNSTCKFWKSEGWAKRYAETVGLKKYTIKHVYPDEYVEHDGSVVREVPVPGKPNYHTLERR